jgi:hypothetical protein
MAIPPGSLQAQYDLSDPLCYPGTGNTIFDLSGNARDATKTGTVGFVSDGQASYLDLTGAGYFTSSSFLIPSIQNWTFTGWFYCDEPIGSAGYYFISSVTSITNDPTYGGSPFIAFGWAVPSVWAGSATYNRGTVWAPLQANLTDWYYITYTSNGTNTELYINGVSVGTQNQDTRILGTNMNLRLGSSPDSLDEAVGKLAYAEMYSTCLAAGDVLALYNATASRFAPPPVPIAQYDFQNGSYPGSGTTVFDLSGIGNTLAITSGGTWVSGTPNYFDLQGNTAIFKSPAIGGIASTNVFTINGWYYLPTTVLNSVVLDVGKDIANQSAQIASGFGLGELFASGGFAYGVLEYTGAAQPGWNFISYVSTGSSSTAYLNGASVGSTTNVPSLPSDAGIIIGTALNNASPPVPRLDLAAVGRVGYFDIYNVALDPADISTIFEDTKLSYQNLVAQYDFSDTNTWTGTGNTAYDISGFGNNLTLDNGPLLTGTGTSKTLELRRVSAQTARKSTDLNGITDIPMTFNIWSKVNPSTNSQALMSYGIVGDSTIPGIWPKFFNEFITFEGGFSNPTISSGITANNTDFYNIIASINPTTVTLYVNGTGVGTSNHTISLPGGSQFSLSGLFGDSGLYLTNADIGLVEVYNVALGSTEVTDLYNTQSPRFISAPSPSSNGVGGRQFAQGFNG